MAPYTMEDLEASYDTLELEAMEAQDKLARLAGMVMDLDLGTPKGLAVKQYARQVLGIPHYGAR